METFESHSLRIRHAHHLRLNAYARADVPVRLVECVYGELIHHRRIHEIAINIFGWRSASIDIRIGYIRRNGFPVAAVHVTDTLARLHLRPGTKIVRTHTHECRVITYIAFDELMRRHSQRFFYCIIPFPFGRLKLLQKCELKKNRIRRNDVSSNES